MKPFQSFHFKYVKRVVILKDIYTTKKHANRESKMTETWKDYGIWDELILGWIYNGSKYMLNFDVAECGMGNR